MSSSIERVTEALEAIRADHDDESAWIADDLFAEKVGRLVTYPANRFHARFPRFGYGATIETCRIVLVTFLDPVRF